MMKSDMVTKIIIDNIKSNIAEIKLAQEKLDKNPENEEYKWILKHSKENLKSRINRLIQRIDSSLESENEGITIIDGENNKKAVNELIESLSNLGLPEFQSQKDNLKNHLSGKVNETKLEENSELEINPTKTDFSKNDITNTTVNFRSPYDFDNFDVPYNNNMWFVNDDKPYDNNMDFVNNNSHYNNMDSYATYTSDQVSNGEVVESNDSTLKAKPEGIKNKAIEAFKRLISKLKQLTTKKEKIEKEIEKRPSIDKKQLDEKVQQSERKPIFQRFKELMSRLLKNQKTKAAVEAEINRRNLKEFINESKDVAQETINSTKEKITERATDVKNKAGIVKDKVVNKANIIKDNLTERASTVKNKANEVKDKIVDKATAAKKTAFRGFKTAGMVTIGTGVLAAEAIAKASKDVKDASKRKINEMISSGNANAHNLLDKMEEAIIKKEAKTTEKINELQHYNPKSADAVEK